MQLKIKTPFLFIFTILFSICSVSVQAGVMSSSDGKPVQPPNNSASAKAYVYILSVNPRDALRPTDQSEPKIVVYHKGNPLPFDKPIEWTKLESGDRIIINDKTNRAYIYLMANVGPVQITASEAKKPGYKVDTSPKSILANAWEKFFNSVGTTLAVAATKGRGKEELTIPAGRDDREPVSAQRKLAAGERELHFLWQGGEPPYRLSLVHDDQVIDGSEIEVTKGHEASLPKLTLSPGNYQLRLKDKKGLENPCLTCDAWLEDMILVAPADVPPMPEALVNTPLPVETRQLLYAQWLSRQGQGEWRMEAIQHVTPYAKDYEPAADWLRQWGGQ